MVEEEEKEPTVRVSPDLEIIYVSGGIGIGVDIDGIMMAPYISTFKAGEMEISEKGPPIEFVIKHLMILPPFSAKLLVGLLDRAVKHYEQMYGKIPAPPSERKRKKK